MTMIKIDVTPTLKTLRLTGRMVDLRLIEGETSTWARYKDRTLELPAVRGALDAIFRAHDESTVEITPDALKVIKRVDALAEQEEAARKAKEQDYHHLDDYEFGGKFPPWEHQRKAFALSRKALSFGYFMEMGTGKTRVGIDLAAYLFEQGHIDACIIYAPNGVHRQWMESAIPEHIPSRINHSTWAHRPTRKEPEDLLKATPGKLKFLSLNSEQLSVKSGQDRLTRFIATIGAHRLLVIVDESSMFANPRSKRTQFLVKTCAEVAYKRILDGLPIAKGLQDIYSQFDFLNPDIIGVSSFTGFRNRYCKMGGWEGRAIVGYKNVSELLERTRGHSFRVRKEDCLDLPKKMDPVQYWIDMTPEQKKLYDQMKKNLFILLESGEVLKGDIGAVKVMRMHQIACGHLPDGKGGWAPVKNHRFTALKKILDRIDGKTVIMCRWVPDVLQLVETLGNSCVEYSGRVGANDREAAIYALQNDPDVTSIVVQEAAGGVGVDGLQQAANNMIYFSNMPSTRLRKQSEDRIHRGGQTKVCSYWDIVIPNSVDTMILDVIKNDFDFATKCLDSEYLKQFI